MAKLHGKNFAVYADGVKVGDATDCTLNLTQEIIPTTSKDDANWEDSITGTRGWSVSVDYIEDDTNSLSMVEIIDTLLDADELLVEFTPEGATTSGTYWYGQAFTESTSANAPMGAVNGSVTFHGKGALSTATYAGS
jgi:hypothetical protein